MLSFRKSDAFLNARCLTNSIAEIVELSTSDLTYSGNNYLLNVRRMKGEGLFDANTVCNAANGEGLRDTAAILSDNGSFEDLGTGALTLDYTAVNLNVVTDVELGGVCLELLICESLDNIHCWLLLIFRVFVQSVAEDHP